MSSSSDKKTHRRGKSLFEALTGRDKATKEYYVSSSNVVRSALGEVFGDFAREADPPSGEVFNHVEVEEIDVNIYRLNKESLWLGPFPTKQNALFGGQIIGGAAAAVANTLPKDSGKTLNSLHAYFLRPGTNVSPIVYTVTAVNEGKSFSTRSVVAQQRGVPIFSMLSSYQKQEVSPMQHQRSMPKVPLPESLPTEEQRYQKVHDDPRCPQKLKKVLLERIKRPNPIDIRYVESLEYFGSDDKTGAPRQICWMKAKERLTDDPIVHTAVIAYCSDLTLLATARGSHSALDLAFVASLDHAMWFHCICRADEWMLFVTTSPRSVNGRSLANGHIYNQDGVLCVSASQEGVLRFREPQSNGGVGSSSSGGGGGGSGGNVPTPSKI